MAVWGEVCKVVWVGSGHGMWLYGVRFVRWCGSGLDTACGCMG